MKKILSLTLAALMVVSMIPTAFAADVDYKNGTEVEYTGTRSTVEDDGSVTHNAEYTITVPALLAPGGSGTVTLEGYWPSDATVKVTADASVDMLNSINNADKKTLTVTFAGIELAGSNTATVTDNETVSVSDISAALFGTWSGKFNYNVEYNGEAGGSGTVTPTPDPDQPSDPDTGDDDTVQWYSYNGYELPKLPDRTELDMELYPNIAIAKYTDTQYKVFAFQEDIQYSTLNDYRIIQFVPAEVPVYEQFSMGMDEADWTWTSSMDSSSMYVNNPTAYTVIWSNFDILNEDGSVFLAASDPVPVS